MDMMNNPAQSYTWPDGMANQMVLFNLKGIIRSCKQSATDGYVLVPFAGSGSECLAAKNIGLPFVGIELNAEYVKLIHERLKDSDKQSPSPTVP